MRPPLGWHFDGIASGIGTNGSTSDSIDHTNFRKWPRTSFGTVAIGMRSLATKAAQPDDGRTHAETLLYARRRLFRRFARETGTGKDPPVVAVLGNAMIDMRKSARIENSKHGCPTNIDRVAGSGAFRATSIRVRSRERVAKTEQARAFRAIPALANTAAVVIVAGRTAEDTLSRVARLIMRSLRFLNEFMVRLQVLDVLSKAGSLGPRTPG